MRRSSIRLVSSVLACVSCVLSARAAANSRVLELRYTPVARAQVAIWVEDGAGVFLATVALTEAVAYRGIGNRPGASQMNSGYRWPYGRREGTLPLWAHRRASAPGARAFPRVIYQERPEGLAIQRRSDQSPDDYYCLEYDVYKSQRDALDAVSCASQFNSDKGRYMTDSDFDRGYAEPFELAVHAGMPPVGELRRLPREALYPPRMDAVYCDQPEICFDHPDVQRFAEDARAVMPEIDAVTRATAPGDVPQTVLFAVPDAWPAGDYVAWIEVNVEGDYGPSEGDWNAAVYPTPSTPERSWDHYAMTYGYAYRGQPSIAYRVPIRLADAPATFSQTSAAGRSSWDHWSDHYGELEPIGFEQSDPERLGDDGGSGADRLRRDAQGRRFVVELRRGDAGAAPPAAEGGAVDRDRLAAVGVQGVVLESGAGPVGAILDLELRPHEQPLRAHSWIRLSFRAARSERPLHAYEVRVSTQPITDEASFLKSGRQAKSATDAAEGATALMLPLDVPAGEVIESAIGDLAADTRWFVALRAVDEQGRSGPISVAAIQTPPRRFATVSACFVATAAYGTPLSAEIQSLRRLRDRHLLTSAAGRAFVAVYQALGPAAARFIAPRPLLRAAARTLLEPLVALARRVP